MKFFVNLVVYLQLKNRISFTIITTVIIKCFVLPLQENVSSPRADGARPRSKCSLFYQG